MAATMEPHFTTTPLALLVPVKELHRDGHTKDYQGALFRFRPNVSSESARREG